MPPARFNPAVPASERAVAEPPLRERSHRNRPYKNYAANLIAARIKRKFIFKKKQTNTDL